MKKKYVATIRLSHFGNPKEVEIETEQDLTGMSLEEKEQILREQILTAIEERLNQPLATSGERNGVIVDAIEVV